jgi:hypothetical protein
MVKRTGFLGFNPTDGKPAIRFDKRTKDKINSVTLWRFDHAADSYIFASPASPCFQRR